jgi:hypothetical protein
MTTPPRRVTTVLPPPASGFASAFCSSADMAAARTCVCSATLCAPSTLFSKCGEGTTRPAEIGWAYCALSSRAKRAESAMEGQSPQKIPLSSGERRVMPPKSALVLLHSLRRSRGLSATKRALLSIDVCQIACRRSDRVGSRCHGAAVPRAAASISVSPRPALPPRQGADCRW